MAQLLESPPLPLPSNALSSESSQTSNPLVEWSSVPSSSFRTAASGRRKARKHKALACMLSAAAAVSLLAICFHAHRMSVAASNTRRALAREPLHQEDDSEEQERARILESCLDLEEEYNFKRAPIFSLAEEDDLLSQILSSIKQQSAEFIPGSPNSNPAHLVAGSHTQDSHLRSSSAQPSVALTGWPSVLQHPPPQIAGQQLEGWNPPFPYAPRAFDASTTPSTTATLNFGGVITVPQAAPPSPEFVASAPSLAELGLQEWRSYFGFHSAQAVEADSPPMPRLSASANEEQPGPSGLSQGSKRTSAENRNSGSVQLPSAREQVNENVEKRISRKYRARDRTAWRKTFALAHMLEVSSKKALGQEPPSASTEEEASVEQPTSVGPLASPVPSTSTRVPAPMPHAAAASSHEKELEASFIEINMRSGPPVRIQHPPPAMPADTHPYYRLPPAPSSPTLILLREEGWLIHSGGRRTVKQSLDPIRRLLAKPQLTYQDAQELLFSSRCVVDYLSQWHKRPLNGRIPNVAAYVLGLRFLCLEALVSVIQVLGPAMNAQQWFPWLVATVPTNFDPKAFRSEVRTTHHMWLATQLSGALEQLKHGRRPSMTTVVMLKRALFHHTSAPLRFKNPEWDPWRSDDP
ncbi:hypothetical protein Emag_003394 [Eimeria magna]